LLCGMATLMPKCLYLTSLVKDLTLEAWVRRRRSRRQCVRRVVKSCFRFMGWSDTPSNEKRRSLTPVPEETCTECPAGPARRLYKGRDWSFGIHWRGTPWQTGRALGVL